MHIYCPTEHAILLLGFPDHQGVLSFPTQNTVIPGILLPVKPLTPINDQIISFVFNHWDQATGKNLHLWQNFSSSISLGEKKEATLYVGRVDETFSATRDKQGSSFSWSTLPQILKALPKDKSRLPYIKAFQVLTGALTLTTRAVDLTDNELS